MTSQPSTPQQRDREHHQSNRIVIGQDEQKRVHSPHITTVWNPMVAADYLTGAQATKLCAIGDGQPKEFPLHASGLRLIEMGLVFVNELGARHLTDKGHAVRRVLEQGMRIT